MFVTIPLVQRREAGIRLLDRDGLVILGEVEDNSLDDGLDVEAGSEDRDIRGDRAKLADELVKYLERGNLILDCQIKADMSAIEHFVVVNT